MKVQSFQVFFETRWAILLFCFQICKSDIKQTSQVILVSGDELQSTDIPLIILSFKPFFQRYRSSYQPMLQSNHSSNFQQNRN